MEGDESWEVQLVRKIDHSKQLPVHVSLEKTTIQTWHSQERTGVVQYTQVSKPTEHSSLWLCNGAMETMET